MASAELYGLTLSADFDLHDAAAATERGPEVTIVSAPAFEEWAELPDGPTLLDFWTGDDHWYQLVRKADGDYLFRVPSICDYAISGDLSQIELAMHADAASGMDSVMTTGALLSLLLYLKGSPVFHGSAVDIGGEAIAFIGHSGQGKTTMATLFCAEGAAAVTDDVLVIDSPGERPAVRRGSRELRLRSGIEEVAAQVPGSGTRVSADERLVISPQHSGERSIPLRAIVIPRPMRDGSELRFERLSARDATFALLSFPRLMGWKDEQVLTESFRDAAALARTTPVVVAFTPWGPPFPENLTRSLLEYLDSSDSAS